ncbi:hypothetical protein Poli38472_011255 [Pythium oligandrum]|uniref:Uncharacterized protein n=1 Tax=Pythium oligandrum TaxID=41045 RepID=A0A8K1FKY5_PYTOL|nr:hypothetical protein Poli38472_011255 [Pythium oligandrum]|eukprot:TMW67635.1 hypothetical protein Poli38472_011255 [Pythium oligandrum]
MMIYSDEERKLRNMRIEHLKMERNNSENQYRTQLRLLQNRIQLQEQELQHIQSKITAAQAQVDDVWKDVVRVPRSSPSKRSQQARDGPLSKGAQEIPSVLGRFECYISRLQRKFDIETKAAAMLAKPWKQQMEELQLRMVIKIQRAYRARRKARMTRKKAREDLSEKIRARELQKQNELMNRKRQEALREKDMQKHRARITARKEQEEKARAAIEKKQEALIARLREEEIEQRDGERNRRLKVRMFKKWSAFLTIRRKCREANRLFLKIQFMRWRHFHREYQRIQAACRVIQRSFRRRRELRKLRKVMMMSAKRNKLARRYLQKLQMRQLQQIFNVWAEKTSKQLTLKANYQAILQKRHAYWFERWINFVIVWKQRVLECVLLIQRVYRGRIAREVVRYHRRRVAAATSLQRIFRGIRGREIARVRKMIRSRQDTGTRTILQRIQHRQAFICLCQLHNHAHRERTIKNMAIRHRESLVRNVFYGFVSYRDHKQEKRAEFLRLQYSSAVTIQRHYRRHRCEQLFHISLRYHRAAVKIQRVYRGFRGREYVKKCRWEIQAAETVQTAWRKRRAWRLAEATKAEMILLAAYKGDFTSTRRSIENGNWYVTDAEGNGILHVAAAAGHKRLVKLCLRYYMDINAVNKHNQTALHLLLANLPPSGYEGNASMIEERVALAEYMIDHGAWHEAADDHGITPLLLCAGLGQTEATEMLLERVANTEARSSGGMNAAQLAVEGNHFKTLRVLLASRGFNSRANTTDTLHLLHACAGRGLVDCLRVLVEHLEVYTIQEDQFNARDDDGYTPLIYAISNSNIDAVQCLLEHGASPDIKDYFGRAPLHFAVSVGDAGSSAAVELLTTYDADVNVKDTDGDAALHMCCDRDSRLECTVLLLRHGAFIGSNALGNHPTHIAARYGAVDTLKILIEYGADMNIKNYEGKTPLGMARMYSQSKVVQFVAVYFASDIVGDDDSELIDQEADPDAGDKPDKDDEKHPVMTLEDWAHTLSTAYRLGTLAEWTHYVDVTTECSFFSMDCSREGEPPFCTWDTPVEFDAALGEHWEVIRGGGTSVASRTHNSPMTTVPTGHTDYDDLLPALGGKGVQYFYHHKATSEVRETAPPIDYALLQDVVQNSKRHKMLRQRIRKVSGAASATAMEYMRFFYTFEEESAQTRAELRAAVKIQRHFRARRTTRMVRQLLYENKCAVDLQRAFRGRKARRAAADIRKEHACATKIQAVWRGFRTRQLEKNVHHAERLAHLNRRKMAIKIQRLFRGYVARKLFYREKVVQKLGPRGYFAWEQARRRAITIQSFRVWDEMELRGEFPCVYFYCHQVTRSCSWEKPPDWQVHDRFQFEERRQLFRWGYTQAMKQSAVRLQRLWRARQARISFRLIMKSVQLMKTSERDYLEDPTNLVKMGNYVLFLHAILHEYDRARPLYARLMRMMAQRGPDVPFILFSYGIFLYVTQEDDVALVEDMILRAKLKDKQLTKYKMAYLGFFRQSMIQNPHNAESNLNYAACLQWLFEQYEESTKYYLRAIAANPRKKGIMELFQDMLNRKRQVDKAKNPSLFKPPRGVKRSREEEDELRAQYEGYELFRRWQVKQAEEDDQRRKLQYEAEKEAADRLDAAKKIQTRYRRRRAMRQVNRAKNERQVALSMVELAQQKVVYDLVQEAFDQVVASQPAQKSTFGGMLKTKKTATKQMTLSIAQLDAVFRIMTHGLTDEELNAAVNDFRSQYPKLQNVNVMDMTKFAQRHPTLSTHLNARKNEKQVK